MDYKQLQSFKTVVECKNFSLAADRLSLSQPTVSMHIKNLETELETKLIIRSSRSLELTSRGKEVFECVDTILNLWDSMVTRCHDNDKKVIRIGASTIPASYMLPKLLLEYGKKYENIYFVVNQGNSEEIIQSVCNGQSDVGLVGSDSDDSRIVCEKIYQDKLTLITPVNSHFMELKSRKQINLIELLQEPIIIREQNNKKNKGMNRLFHYLNVCEEDLNIVSRENDQEKIKQLVSGGLGISVISEKSAEDYIAEKRLLSFELPKEVAGKTFYLIYPLQNEKQKEVEQFIDYIKMKQL